MTERLKIRQRAASLLAGFAITAVTLVFITGCANRPNYTLSPEFRYAPPRTVAIMPTSSKKADVEARDLLRKILVKKLTTKRYNVLSLSETDKLISKIGKKKAFAITPEELSVIFKVDSVLYPFISTWNKRLFVTYGSLRIGTRFELYGKDGSILWKGYFKTREFDISFDRDQVKLAVVNAYEPRIQRIVEAVFMTLPTLALEKKKYKKKEFFRWLK